MWEYKQQAKKWLSMKRLRKEKVDSLVSYSQPKNDVDIALITDEIHHKSDTLSKLLISVGSSLYPNYY